MEIDTVNQERDEEKMEEGPDEATEKIQQQHQHDSHLIQITASSEEINRRIAAFIEQKQREVDLNNCREFCGVHGDLEEDIGCARTAAVFVPRAGGKSHIKVSRVLNMYGPQTRALSSPVKHEKPQEDGMRTGIEERLFNMEQHLRIAGSSKSDVFSRLKSLEERILFLESLSPEYFSSGPPPPKRHRSEVRKSETPDEEMSLSEIDSRIQALKESLLRRSANR